MSIDPRERFSNLREKAGDGETDFFVEVRQSDLRWLLDPCVQAGRHVCGPVDGDLILGRCPHGVDLDCDICPKGCRV